ncbi:hypothetical protein DFH07DRAFT_1038602 [Mycena maculata]|uniref:Meiotically up-regulated protein Msb1/Mug8 domain-containing protein n=1 Tax=Mycena maculata TaxID=230809 RepID=A0AAD7N5B9_9AGAR|nr:hypothetical protein DFH07DRAFT_1038602 [Mycena maculata]
MPSLFSRARTASTPSKHKPALTLPPTSSPSKSKPSPSPIDEFGVRDRTQSLGPGAAQEGGYGAVGFLPTTLPASASSPWAGAPPSLSATGQPVPAQQRAAYGLLSPARDAVLGLPDCARLVARVCAELERTGVATPFVFSALALDVRRAGVARLVAAFLATCADASSSDYSNGGASDGLGGRARAAEEKWAEEARFAGAHELGMCLRWGLSRVVRVEGGREVRGLLSWAWYEKWREEEKANGYPPTAYSTLLASLPAQLPPILSPLFALCTRLVAHSNKSGETPPTLASVVGPLLFGLGAPAASSYPTSPAGKSDRDRAAEEVLFPTIEDFSSFPATYAEYLRGARAAEHVLLACIREGVGEAEGRGLGAPTRLREWVGMYPSGVGEGAGKNPRRGAKTARVVHVRRNVRAYAPDLVRGGSAWAGAGGSGGPPNEWAASKAWRTILAGGAGTPRYSEPFRKRLDLAVGVHPATASSSSISLPYGAPFNASSLNTSTGAPYGTSGSPSAYNLSAPSTTSLTEDGSAFRSLTDLKWGEFESLGFGGSGEASPGGAKEGGIEGRLRFDLTENARAERMAKRETLSWTDFSTAGFTRSDAPLSATLQFSPPLTLSPSALSAPTALNAELTRKLRKAHKALPAFGWDTQPVLGPEEVVEEAFVDVFCDLLWGGGWMERAAGVGGPAAELARECSWALVEYKSRSGGAQDPGATLVLFEEFVPREYRLALAGAAPPGTKRRLPALFSPAAPSGGKVWKQAPTLNGRPYILGATPSATGSSRELDFEGMLRAQGGTKILSLGTKRASAAPGPGSAELAPSAVQAQALAMARTRSDDSSAESGDVKGGRRQSGARFRLPGGMIPGPSPGSGGRVRAGMAPAEASALEFETRLAGESDDEGGEEEAARQRRRESASDAWVDILVGSVQARRMGGQDAEMGRRRRGGFVGGPDPDLASMEVAQALAAETMGREVSPDPDDIDLRRERRAREQEQRLRDSDVSEIERVPRASEQSERSMYEEDDAASEGYGPPTDNEEDEDATTPSATHPVLSQRQEARQQRRLGYFDLHPERRPPSVATNDDDPRSFLSGTDSDDDHDVAIPVPRNLDIRPLPTPTGPAHISPVSPVDIPEFDDAENKRRADREGARSKADSAILTPSAPTAANGNGHGNAHQDIASPKPAAPSKTSALIDMFREREQRTASPAKPTLPASPAQPAAPAPALAPSRLPVRTTSRDAAALTPEPTKPPAPLPKTPPAPVSAPLPKPPAPTPAPAPAKTASPPLLDPTVIEPPRPLLDSGRASPARYVHGAPLHNVLEEEEEEP